MRLSLKWRSILALTLVLSTSFILISVLNYTTARTAITKEITGSSLPLLRENIYSELQRDFLPSMHIASMMATDSFLKNWTLGGERDTAAVVQYLKEIKGKYGYKSTFFVSASTGRYYYFGGVLKTVSPQDAHDAWFYAFRDSGKDYRLDVDTDQAARDRLTIFINYRLNDYAGRFLGVAGVGIVMDDFSSFLREKESQYKRRIYLTDRGGLIQAHPDLSNIRKESAVNLPNMRTLFSDLAEKRNQPLDTVYDGKKGKVLLTGRYIPEMDWFLIVEQDEEEALRTARDNLIQTILIGSAASLLIILMSVLTVNSFHNRLEELASTDSLTGCANRREFEMRIKRLFYRRLRYAGRVSIILIDVDNFKKMNDTFGHQEGDRVLKDLAAAIEKGIRPDDLCARLGGDEFVIAVESGEDEARVLAERLRIAFSKYAKAEYPTVSGLSLSIGTAEAAEGDDSDSLLKKADQALYRAKNGGRDQVAAYETSGTEPA